ncbi:helix-turn-helix transcriptional regulator [Microvirga aerophila]|nr:hypothetical protein [Microvirga aerophila]
MMSKPEILTADIARDRVLNTALNNLPPDLARHRILDSTEAATFWGVSVPHWRRLYRANEVPAPIKLGARKLGWRVGDLIDALAARAA